MITPLHLIQTVYSLNVIYIYWVTRMKKKGKGLNPFFNRGQFNDAMPVQ